MQENLMLAIYVVLPVITGVPLFFLLRRVMRNRETPTTTRRLIAGNLLMLCFMCSFLLLGGEIYYRFFHDTTDSFGLTKTTTKWFQTHFAFNYSGFRDSIEYEARIEPGARRVTFIGDSFTAAHGVADVEQRFGNRVRAAHPNYEVHVLAQCGWDTGQQLSLVEMANSTDYQWDIVVLAYCLNDIADIVPEWQTILNRIYSREQPAFIFQHSYFLNALYFRWKAFGDRDIANYYGFVRNNYEGPVWQQQQERLTALRDMVDAKGGRLFVVTFPFIHALQPEYEYRDVHKRLDEFWSRLNVPHLDLLPVFETQDKSKMVVNQYDAHPNAAAHNLAANAINDFLKKNAFD